MWVAPKIWTDGDCWIVGGGASIAEQFNIPGDVITRAKKNPSLMTPYFDVLRKKHIIAINAAFRYLPFADILFFGDQKFFDWYTDEIQNYPKIPVTCCLTLQHTEGVRYMVKNKNKPHGISTLSGTVSWNGNSGAAAISLAVQMGVKRIFLLGFDMCRQKEKKHFHEAYTGLSIRGKPQSNKDNFVNHLKGFPAIKRDAMELGIKIYNVSPDSAITQFPKLTLKEALHA